MIQSGTMLRVIDNSGALIVKCISVLSKKQSRVGLVGDIIICSVKKCLSNKKLNVGDIKRGIIVNQRKIFQRKDGLKYCFLENRIVLIDNNNNPIGNRVQGILPKELRQKKNSKVLSICSMVL